MGRWNKNNKGQESSESTGRWSKPDYIKEKENKALDAHIKLFEELVEKADKDWKQPWFNISKPFIPRSVYGVEYSGQNAFMLAFLSMDRGWKIPVFATGGHLFNLNFGKDADGNKVPLVNKETGEKLPFVHNIKGEDTFPVIFTKMNYVHKETKAKIDYDDYTKLSDEEKENYNVFPFTTIYEVYNIDQTNLKEARPELYEKYRKMYEDNDLCQVQQTEDFSLPVVDDMMENDKWFCKVHIESSNRAFYRPSEKAIHLPLKEQYTNPREFYSTAFHETVHAVGDEEYFNRKKGKAFGDPDYAREELVAETGSALLCLRYGVAKTWKDDVIENSAAYFKGWKEAIKKDPKYLKTVFTDAKASVRLISDKIDQEVELQQNNNTERKLDIRETEEESLSVDEEGNVEVTMTEDLDPDKKQGEDEKDSQSQAEEQQRQSHRRR